MPSNTPTDAAATAKPRATRKTAAKKSTKRSTKAKAAAPKRERKERLFALDIGTRSVIGIVAQREASGLKIITTYRQEHKTRAMLDGQIHDVPEVAAVIKEVKKYLVKETGALAHAAVAAAGRALYTMTADAELDIGGIVTAEQERGLEFAGVQAAQAKLASSGQVEDPTEYYCVGYSTVQFYLDNVPLKNLVGQRGKVAKATVIATFLPRQVIDSMQSALREAKLDMRAITLEPIAAINVLIPQTMRHLNLVLVDIGAGTSDVAITKNGSVIAYGMVPLAGDEITEAISQRYLLDFNVAEDIKRRASSGEDCHFSDILGTTYDLKAAEIIEPIMPAIKNLADAIAQQIMTLNGTEPQAVLLVGGGSLTPKLPDLIADALKLPAGRVAVRRPELVDGIEDIPDILHSPDAVTPLGILKIAAADTMHFLKVFVNGTEFRLFNFRHLMVSDALLNAGIKLKKLNGKPGLGIMLTVDGQPKFIPGTMGTLARLTLDGLEADLDSPIENGSRIAIEPGVDGTPAAVTCQDVFDIPPEFCLTVNGEEKHLAPRIFVNGEPAAPDRLLKDGDSVSKQTSRTVGETLLSCGLSPTGAKLRYTMNGSDGQYTAAPTIRRNNMPTTLSATVSEGDALEYIPAAAPTLGDIMHLSELDTGLTIYFNKTEQRIPAANLTVTVNGKNAYADTVIPDGAEIRHRRDDSKATIVSDALLAVNFTPPPPSSGCTVDIFVNGQPAQFTDPIKNGDALDIAIKHGNASTKAKTAAPAAQTPAAIPSLDVSDITIDDLDELPPDVSDKVVSVADLSRDRAAASELLTKKHPDDATAAINNTIAAAKTDGDDAATVEETINGLDGLLDMLVDTEKETAPPQREGLLGSLIIEPKTNAAETAGTDAKPSGAASADAAQKTAAAKPRPPVATPTAANPPTANTVKAATPPEKPAAETIAAPKKSAFSSLIRRPRFGKK